MNSDYYEARIKSALVWAEEALNECREAELMLGWNAAELVVVKLKAILDDISRHDKTPEFLPGAPWQESSSGILMPRDDIRE